jgi:hypothetical protein
MSRDGRRACLEMPLVRCDLLDDDTGRASCRPFTRQRTQTLLLPTKGLSLLCMPSHIVFAVISVNVEAQGPLN